MALLIILLPLLSSLFCLMYGYKIGRLGVVHISIFTISVTFFLSLFLFYTIALKHEIFLVTMFSWVSTDFINITWTFLFDSLSVTMLLVVTLVSTVVHFYSTSYMAQDPQLPRF